jgi:hypothetical protein
MLFPSKSVFDLADDTRSREILSGKEYRTEDGDHDDNGDRGPQLLAGRPPHSSAFFENFFDVLDRWRHKDLLFTCFPYAECISRSASNTS